MEFGNRSTDRSKVAWDVLSYLIDNPDAQDTLEGIVEWWILQRTIENQTKTVQAVLAELTAKGLILERRGSDSRLRYLINANRQEEIRALLGRG